ncbi:hypothetical protein PV325_012265 [Microctonus aethiopoides]|nr:hypothetical protein PV325_012265 [Microctonus aethiopoides]
MPLNIFANELECENEVYSVHQLEARGVDENLRGDENIIEEETFEETLVQDIVNELIPEDTAAVKVEANILMDADEITSPERTSPLTVAETILKERLPEAKREILFQGKPILDYESSERLCGTWLQSVTRNFSTSATAESTDSPVQESPLSSTITCRQPLQTATASIFAPRTEDMNKGFLTFSEDQPGLTMLKDEPEDLTHLAPTPGDVCVPLEDSPFLSDMLDEFILSNENYCSMLSPSLPNELPIVDLADDTMKECNSLDNSLESDPFFYRDATTSPTSDITQSSPNLLSPALDTSSKSPGIDSFCSSESSRTAFGSGLSEDDMLMLSINDVTGDEELALRAPFIPMSDQDEALQLLISNDMVMWGPTQPPDKRSKWNEQSENTTKDYLESSLAKLLKGNDDMDKRIGYGANSMVDPVQVLGQTSRRGILERPNKRLHGPTSPNSGGENKRMRYSESKKLNLPSKNIAATEFDVDTSRIVTTNGDLRNRKFIRVSEKEECDKGVRHQGQTLLLQQLMSDRVTLDPMTKTPNLTCDESNNRQNDEHSGQNQQRKRQSNSVLMNLLVSGCDQETCVELPTMLQEKVQTPLTINVDDIYSSPWLSSPYLTNYTLNANSPSPKKFLVDSLNYEPSIDSYNTSSPLYNAEFNNNMEHNVGPPLSPRSELLKVLSE